MWRSPWRGRLLHARHELRPPAGLGRHSGRLAFVDATFRFRLLAAQPALILYFSNSPTKDCSPNWLRKNKASIPVMNLRLRSTLWSLWSRPDPVLARAAIGGELLVAKIRLTLATVLLLIPLIDSLFFPDDPKEALVGLTITGGTFLLSLLVFLMIRKEYNPPWLSFASSAFDVTLVSTGLALFLLLQQPLTAVNSKVVFEGYFLAIGASGLRYDKRICITAGLLACGEYLAIVSFASDALEPERPRIRQQ